MNLSGLRFSSLQIVRKSYDFNQKEIIRLEEETKIAKSLSWYNEHTKKGILLFYMTNPTLKG